MGGRSPYYGLMYGLVYRRVYVRVYPIVYGWVVGVRTTDGCTRTPVDWCSDGCMDVYVNLYTKRLRNRSNLSRGGSGVFSFFVALCDIICCR